MSSSKTGSVEEVTSDQPLTVSHVDMDTKESVTTTDSVDGSVDDDDATRYKHTLTILESCDASAKKPPIPGGFHARVEICIQTASRAHKSRHDIAALERTDFELRKAHDCVFLKLRGGARSRLKQEDSGAGSVYQIWANHEFMSDKALGQTAGATFIGEVRFEDGDKLSYRHYTLDDPEYCADIDK